MEGARAVPLAGHVGFDSMPDQLVNKSVNHGFCFNILCVGECVICNFSIPFHSGFMSIVENHFFRLEMERQLQKFVDFEVKEEWLMFQKPEHPVVCLRFAAFHSLASMT